MPPHNMEFPPTSTLGIIPPATRPKGHKLTVDVWLDDKKDTDRAENLWRIHDDIFDFSEFIDKHPGGSEWLTLTKGTDITEAFEAHHISTLPEEMSKKYFVKKAKNKRNFPFTFHEDGFYRTLKGEMRKVIATLPKQSYNTSLFMIDALCFFTFLFAVVAVRQWSFLLAIFSGNLLAMLTIAAHNYIHRRDNFRMYYFQFSLLQVREFRISHVLSHHLHTNTIDDLEISILEPLLQYLPISGKPAKGFGCYVIAPLVWISYFHIPLIRRYATEGEADSPRDWRARRNLGSIGHSKGWNIRDNGEGVFQGAAVPWKLAEAPSLGYRNLKWTDLSSFLLPLAMIVLGGQSLLATFAMWNFIVVIAAVHFAFVGLHAAHHHPDIFHDGDAPRSSTNYDWGLSQLDAIMDRKEISGSHFLVLTNFGDHCLHHLFPTLDHGYLEHLYPVFEEVMNRFDVHLRMVSQWDLITGGFQQLTKVRPNPNPPDLLKYKKKVN